MFVCMDAYPDALRITVSSEKRPKKNSLFLQVYKNGRRIFMSSIVFYRVYYSPLEFSESTFKFFQKSEKMQVKKCLCFMPKYLAFFKIPINLEACCDCSIKILEVDKEGAYKELEIRSFENRGSQAS